MELTLAYVNNGTAEIAASSAHPNLRLFAVGHANAPVPQADTPATTATTNIACTNRWMAAAPSATTNFSAVCYLTLKRLAAMSHKPGEPPPIIGMIHAPYGGTPIEAWSLPSGLEKCAAVGETGTPFSVSSRAIYRWVRSDTARVIYGSSLTRCLRFVEHHTLGSRFRWAPLVQRWCLPLFLRFSTQNAEIAPFLCILIRNEGKTAQSWASALPRRCPWLQPIVYNHEQGRELVPVQRHDRPGAIWASFLATRFDSHPEPPYPPPSLATHSWLKWAQLTKTSISGVLWFQGEENAAENRNQCGSCSYGGGPRYACLMQASHIHYMSFLVSINYNLFFYWKPQKYNKMAGDD